MTEREECVHEYNAQLVSRWDRLVNWDERRRTEAGFFASLLRRLSVNRIADVATGTGFHSIELMAASFDVTSFDRSELMLAQAQQNAERHGARLKVVQVDWRNLALPDMAPRYDAVICLGNSFAHLLDRTTHVPALKKFRGILTPTGYVIIDIRNISSIPEPPSVVKNSSCYFGENVVVSVQEKNPLLRLKYDFGDFASTLTMCPMTVDYMRRTIRAAGLRIIQEWGDLQVTLSVEQSHFVTFCCRSEPV